MRFLLAFVLSFISLFAVAQVAPPMILGGPQGINVTRALVTNWLSIPTYTDTLNSNPGGAPWPGRGYIIQVVKTRDTSLWQYTGQRWSRIAGVSQETFTKLLTGGDVTQLGFSRQYTVSPSTYYINGVFYTLNNLTTVTSASKTANANGRIDVITLATSGVEIVQGTETPVPLRPSVGVNRIELAAIYYRPFDTVPRDAGNGITSVYRILGRDSLYFTSRDTVFSIKDSIGISRNDTAAMLNNYKFTAANGLTKDSTVFRLGGSLNQNTNINLNTRRLTIIGGVDTTRFFSNGRVSIGGTPDSLSMLRVNGDTRITGNTTYNGNLLPLSSSGSQMVAGFTRGASTNDPARLQTYTNQGASPTQYFNFDYFKTDLVRNDIVFDSVVFAYNLYNFALNGIATSQRRGGNTFNSLLINPIVRIGAANTQKSYFRGVSFSPTIDSANNVNFVPFSNTVGSNMLNTTSGNTRIGYPLGILTSQNTTAYDTTFKLDVNGEGRFVGTLRLDGSGFASRAAFIKNNKELSFEYNSLGLSGFYIKQSSSNVFQIGNGNFGYNIINIPDAPSSKIGVGIGVNMTSVDTSAILQINSTSKGFLQPRMTNAQRDSIAVYPAAGLQVFSTTDSANYVYRGTGGGWQKIANEISGSNTLNFGSTSHGTSSDITFTVTGAAEGDVVALGIPNSAIVANGSFIAWVSAVNTITVRFNNYASSGSSDPGSGLFKVKVFK